MQYLHGNRDFRCAEQIAHAAWVSLSTDRAYLDYLIEDGIADEFLQYGTIGRPLRLFRMNRGSFKK